MRSHQRQAKVQQLDLLLVAIAHHQHIRRLQIAMQDAAAMQIGQRAQELQEQGDFFSGWGSD